MTLVSGQSLLAALAEILSLLPFAYYCLLAAQPPKGKLQADCWLTAEHWRWRR